MYKKVLFLFGAFFLFALTAFVSFPVNASNPLPILSRTPTPTITPIITNIPSPSTITPTVTMTPTPTNILSSTSRAFSFLIIAPSPPTFVNQKFFLNWVWDHFKTTATSITFSTIVPRNISVNYDDTCRSGNGCTITQTLTKNGTAGQTMVTDGKGLIGGNYKFTTTYFENNGNYGLLDRTIIINNIPSPTTTMTPTPTLSCSQADCSLSGAFVTSCWGKTQPLGTCSKVDVDCNGRVDIIDIQKFTYQCPNIFSQQPTVTPTPTHTPTPTRTPTPTPIRFFTPTPIRRFTSTPIRYFPQRSGITQKPSWCSLPMLKYSTFCR